MFLFFFRGVYAGTRIFLGSSWGLNSPLVLLSASAQVKKVGAFGVSFMSSASPEWSTCPIQCCREPNDMW